MLPRVQTHHILSALTFTSICISLWLILSISDVHLTCPARDITIGVRGDYKRTGEYKGWPLYTQLHSGGGKKNRIYHVRDSWYVSNKVGQVSGAMCRNKSSGPVTHGNWEYDGNPCPTMCVTSGHLVACSSITIQGGGDCDGVYTPLQPPQYSWGRQVYSQGQYTLKWYDNRWIISHGDKTVLHSKYASDHPCDPLAGWGDNNRVGHTTWYRPSDDSYIVLSIQCTTHHQS